MSIYISKNVVNTVLSQFVGNPIYWNGFKSHFNSNDHFFEHVPLSELTI